MKKVKLKYHREIPKDYKIKSVTLTNSNGDYYVSVLTEFEKEIQKNPSNDKVIGLDFSMSELFVSSENQRADYPRYFRMLEEELKKLQKSLSRKVKFSKNWYKQKMKISNYMSISRIVEEIFCINYRKNYLKIIMLWLLKI
nr:transposase [Leptotrichia sp. oral taxon 498]